MEKHSLMGAKCLCVENIEQIKDYVSELIEQKKGGYSVAINAEKIMMYRKNPEMSKIIDASVLPTPDGAGAVIAMKWLYGKKCMKLNLPKTIYELSNEKGYSVFILGAKEEINEKAVNVLKERYPGMIIADRRNGYFNSDDEVSGLIAESKAQIIFAALGSPKQEIFSAKFLKKHPDILFIGCGGTLDALAGKVKSAPDFFRYNNLEWLYRLYQSPKRVKRQWKLPFFLLSLIFAALLKKIRS
jgi:N-acetylglucosaminyldiphosphoundecaprenol N-acetyl-beta-D-mannosaminyltransferase